MFNSHWMSILHRHVRNTRFVLKTKTSIAFFGKKKTVQDDLEGNQFKINNGQNEAKCNCCGRRCSFSNLLLFGRSQPM